MTQREFLEKVIAEVENEEMIDFAKETLDKLDARNEARKVATAAKAAEKEAERAPIREAIYAVMTDEPKTATTLIQEAGVEIKPQAIPHLVKGLILEGKVEKAEVKVTGKGKQVGYVRVPEA